MLAARLGLASLLASTAAAARAAVVAEAPALAAPLSAAPLGAAVLRAAPLALAPAAPALSAPLPLAAAAAALSAPAAALAPAATRAEDFVLVERRGSDRFGRAVLLVDALDPADPARGTVGHVDVAWRGESASLDQPLDFGFDSAARPDGAPAGADLSHFREHLWFGLAVLPEFRRGGLGARLLDEAAARLRAAGARTLFVRATGTSLGFYEKRFGRRVRSVEREDGREGEVYYRLEVDLR